MKRRKNKQASDLFILKQTFLSNAIADISSYIRLTDTKVSIVMGTTGVIISMAALFRDLIFTAYTSVGQNNALEIIIVVLTLGLFFSILGVFIFGMRTIRGQSSALEYSSKWFGKQSPADYIFDIYKRDVQQMNTQDIIDNMAAELYKLNDIFRKKLKMSQRTLDCFILSIIIATIVVSILTISALK